MRSHSAREGGTMRTGGRSIIHVAVTKNKAKKEKLKGSHDNQSKNFLLIVSIFKEESRAKKNR